MAIATLLGSFIHHRLSVQRFERRLFAMLVVLGLVLVIQRRSQANPVSTPPRGLNPGR